LLNSVSGFGKIAVPAGELIFLGILTITALDRSKMKRFDNKRFAGLWTSIQERQRRFHDAIKASRKANIAEFSELPKTIDSVAESLYLALRRADIVSSEVIKSEGALGHQFPVHTHNVGNDPQAKELFRIADKNIAEYRSNFGAVMASVQRTEAQAAVFSTTLDNVRLKMLGYRLTGKQPSMSSQEFLETIAETKMQLRSIDMALDELELTPFPKTISVMPDAPINLPMTPPEIPAEAQARIRINQDETP
jgi:hypothetical protein